MEICSLQYPTGARLRLFAQVDAASMGFALSQCVSKITAAD
jgi:hypothetical protein